uniref:Alternative protein WDR63 n=1 Tax=Homo sapiens TaxID=9606 RepID=L8E9L7_HUMAN|nr:alternative protein WDR63 [Homo sapiens]
MKMSQMNNLISLSIKKTFLRTCATELQYLISTQSKKLSRNILEMSFCLFMTKTSNMDLTFILLQLKRAKKTI